jgi:hypothetical protein
MHPLLTILIIVAGGALAFRLALFAYGMARKDKEEDNRRRHRKILGLDGFDGGGADGGAD